MVMRNRTMEARPTYGPNRTRSSTREQWRRDIPTDQSEHGHRQVNSEGETDLSINQSTVINNRTMDTRPTNGPNRTKSSTRQQRRRDRPTDQTEHGHWQENNEGETDLRINQSMVIDKWTMESRPTYGWIRARSSTIEQWMREKPTDQSEHSQAQYNNGDEGDLKTKKNTVIDKRTMEVRPTYGSIRTRSSTIEQWMRDRLMDQSEHVHSQ